MNEVAWVTNHELPLRKPRRATLPNRPKWHPPACGSDPTIFVRRSSRSALWGAGIALALEWRNLRCYRCRSSCRAQARHPRLIWGFSCQAVISRSLSLLCDRLAAYWAWQPVVRLAWRGQAPCRVAGRAAPGLRAARQPAHPVSIRGIARLGGSWAVLSQPSVGSSWSRPPVMPWHRHHGSSYPVAAQRGAPLSPVLGVSGLASETILSKRRVSARRGYGLVPWTPVRLIRPGRTS